MRPSDEPLFSAVLSFVPGVRLVNARTANVDLAAADTLPLTGGGDIGADYPRQSVAALALIRGTDSPRDAWEFPAGKAFVASGRPILAICRGHQVLNGTLGGHAVARHSGARGACAARPRSAGAALFGRVPAFRRLAAVNPSHHQAVAEPGAGLVAEAWCAEDGVIEQMSHRDHPWCVGVQYHPERGQMHAGLVRAFVEASTARKPT